MTGQMSSMSGCKKMASIMTVGILRPCVVGVDDGDDLDVDLGTVVDDFGIPYIPKNRMSARLRDAALRVFGEAGATPADLDAAVALFGASATTAEQDRVVRVGRAQWPRDAQATVVAAIRAHEDRYGGSGAMRENVTAVLTTTIRRTALDDRKAPRRGSLREVRAVRPGVVFESELSWTRPPTGSELRFLARCVLAVEQIGYGESDHQGRVECALDGDRETTIRLAYGEA